MRWSMTTSGEEQQRQQVEDAKLAPAPQNDERRTVGERHQWNP
jgi:hypothetical protein